MQGGGKGEIPRCNGGGAGGADLRRGGRQGKARAVGTRATRRKEARERSGNGMGSTEWERLSGMVAAMARRALKAHHVVWDSNSRLR